MRFSCWYIILVSLQKYNAKNMVVLTFLVDYKLFSMQLNFGL